MDFEIKDKMLKPVGVDFIGHTGDYFRIWIINLFLNLLTLGVYSPWAKIREKQFFYSNTIIADSPLGYNPNPVVMLKQRLLLFVLLGISLITAYFIPSLIIVMLLVFFLILPWFALQSLACDARHSSYRAINFSFNKNLSEAAKWITGLGVLIPLTLGLIYPYYKYVITKFKIDNHQYGNHVFNFRASAGHFYRYYSIALIIVLLSIVMGALSAAILYGDQLTLFFLGANDPSRAVDIRTAIFLSFAILLLFASVGYVLALAYLKTKIFNMVWSSTLLINFKDVRPVSAVVPLMSFNGLLEVKPMMYIYLTNMFAIILSAGLLIPWAKVRVMNYMISQFQMSSIAHPEVIAALQLEKTQSADS